MDNSKVIVIDTRLRKGLVATAVIEKNEVVAEFDGEVYEADKATDLPEKAANHAIQFAPHTYRDSIGFARCMNHSCEPNCGYRGLFTLVAMRDIAAGEELFFDYEMSEDSDYRIQCLCNTPSCRKVIGSFHNMPSSVREKYDGYISDWLKK